MALLAANLTLGNLASATQNPAPTTPSIQTLTRRLSASFGTMHDQASNTAFITTVMAGTLTQSQLKDHLVQRAIINEEVDRVLRHSHIKPLPYGRDQKQILVLLRDNLRTLGCEWPKPSDAWPLTHTFLDQIKESEKQGPYFALGVFHVYYGGITHGGRDIGGMIDKQLKTNLTYYQKSDGYEAYAKQVNAITDPAAQSEMMRGADAAYPYIIAVNNSDSFNPPK